MFRSTDAKILQPKVGVLVEVGLVEEKVVGDVAKNQVEYELATETCKALLKLSKRALKAGTYQKQFRLPNDHKIFTSLSNLLSQGKYIPV